jgi:magnesium-transporting ATPase (P-type)
MIVNYYGIPGCECIWDKNGPFLVAPQGTPTQSLQQIGFYCAQDGRWYKQLSPNESEYLSHRSSMAIVDLPEQGQALGMPDRFEESPKDKKRANILCIISLLLLFGGFIVNYLLIENNITKVSPLNGIFFLGSFILMIFVNVKYPKNKFGKVLKILYIAQAVIALIVFLAVMAWCVSCLKDCSGGNM